MAPPGRARPASARPAAARSGAARIDREAAPQPGAGDDELEALGDPHRPGDQRGEGEPDHHRLHHHVGGLEHAPGREIARQQRLGTVAGRRRGRLGAIPGVGSGAWDTSGSPAGDGASGAASCRPAGAPERRLPRPGRLGRDGLPDRGRRSGNLVALPGPPGRRPRPPATAPTPLRRPCRNDERKPASHLPWPPRGARREFPSKLVGISAEAKRRCCGAVRRRGRRRSPRRARS